MHLGAVVLPSRTCPLWTSCCWHSQRSDQEQFLFETTVDALVKDTIVALVEVHNLRAKIQMLKMEGEELAKHGPAKPLDKQGIDQYQETPVEKGPHYTMDPTGRRTGNGMLEHHLCACNCLFGVVHDTHVVHMQAVTGCMHALEQLTLPEVTAAELHYVQIFDSGRLAAACSPDVAKVLLKTLDEAVAAASKVRKQHAITFFHMCPCLCMLSCCPLYA